MAQIKNQFYDLAKMERTINRVVWIFIACLILVPSIIIGIVSLNTKNKTDPILGLVFIGMMLFLVVPLNLFLFHIRAKNKRRIAQPLLNPLKEKLGGTIVMPDILHNVTAPRLTTVMDGKILEIWITSTARTLATQLIAQGLQGEKASLAGKVEKKLFIPGGQKWIFRVFIRWQVSTEGTYSFFTRGRFSSVLSNKFIGFTKSKIKEIKTGDTKFDELFCVYSDKEEKTDELFRNLELKNEIEKCLRANTPMATKLEFSPKGVYWFSILKTDTSSDQILVILDAMKKIVSTLSK